MAPRILLVDDHPQNVRLLEGMLGPYGYSIGSASSGDEALRAAAADPPDLVLLDVVMPGISGYEVCRRMRASEPTKFVPIVMVTANPDQDRIAALDAGADDFVVRPFDRQELLARVRSLLRIKSYHDTIEQLNRTLEARVAAQVVEILGLRGLGGTAVFRREGEFWTIAFEGAGFRLRDAKGLHYIAALLRSPGREVHAFDLAGSRTPADERTGAVAGDAGPILDPQAKAEYRARLDELEAELREAEQWNDPERLARANEERELLVHELAAAVGLGGRDRKAASDTERARINVTRAIKSVVERIAEHSPALADHFAARLRTGTFCIYTPDPRSPLRWELEAALHSS
ncbi:MAG: response regulator [Chloroflexi bacterium]|nr:response regulator [Chloroflexota bacterium]MBI2983393.1 response regulator [Chloroflexota bacterium]